MKAALFRCCVVLVVATRNLAIAQHVQSTDCLCYRHRRRTACRTVLRVAVRPVSSELSCTCVCVCARSSCFDAHRPMGELAASGGGGQITLPVLPSSPASLYGHIVCLHFVWVWMTSCVNIQPNSVRGWTHSHALHACTVCSCGITAQPAWIHSYR